MIKHVSLVVCTGALALLLPACSPEGGEGSRGEGEVGEARLAQVDPGYLDWRRYTFEIEKEPLADLLVIGDEDVGRFSRNTEYWYVHTSALGDVGEGDIEVSSTSGNGSPPSLTGDQEFTQPVYLTWQSFTTDPINVGDLYGDATGKVFLRIKVTSGEIYELTWYQTSSSSSAENVTPDGTLSYIGGSVTVPSGHYGFYIDAVVE